MRDKLIGLIENANVQINGNISPYRDYGIETLADHLISNGVIVPPCKVGQTLYLVRQDIRKIIEVIVTAIIQRHTFLYAEVLIVEDNRKSLITLAYWGDRLFPTREEAEQALKGVRE